jgi:hypothetical protein
LMHWPRTFGPPMSRTGESLTVCGGMHTIWHPVANTRVSSAHLQGVLQYLY